MNKIYTLLIVGFLFSGNHHIKTIDQFTFINFKSNDQISNDCDIHDIVIDNNLLDINQQYVFDYIEDLKSENKHYILKQMHNDFEVFGKKARLHLNTNHILSSFSSNFFNGVFNSLNPAINYEHALNIIDEDFNAPNKIYDNKKIIYYVKEDKGLLSYNIDAITYSEAYRYIIDASSGDIIKKWTLIHDDGPAIGQGENLLGEWVDELNVYEGSTFATTGNLVSPYLLCEEYCFDYGDCGGNSDSACVINPSQGICDDNYLEDCNGDCFHEWYLQFPGVGNGFCNDPWIDVPEESIGSGLYNMVDESNIDLGEIFTINSYGGFYENLSYLNSATNTFDSSTPNLSHASGVSAHDYQRKTLDYFWDKHNYAGIDGNGKRTISVVNYGTGGGISQNNAFFNAGLDILSYGIGGGNYRPFCAAQDIVTHEFTHGFTSHNSGLVYENQAGAMNESMSDVFGYLVEAEYQDGGDWTEGEDIRISGGASRSFSNPPTYGDPDNINHQYYVPFTSNPTFANDNGGVHSNSGITNKLFYLVVQGDEHYGIYVDPLDPDINISRSIASDIWFNWNMYYLDSEDDFMIGREKMLQVIIDIFPGDVSKYEIISNAWASVGVGNPIIFGDVNNDTIINIQDIIILISSILGSIELNPDQNFSGDSNMDSVIDILDIVSIINVILGNT